MTNQLSELEPIPTVYSVEITVSIYIICNIVFMRDIDMGIVLLPEVTRLPLPVKIAH